MDNRLTRWNDRQAENARMNPKKQAWQSLDPAAGSLPKEIESALVDADSLPAFVVILVDSEIDREWGAQATLAVARNWAASGHRVILADGCLDHPILHETVGVENGEGVSDMVLYGASAQRIAGRIEERLMLAPTGTPVVEVAAILEHVKWDMMISGCREAKATLVFHVSTGTPGANAMTARAEQVLVLAPESRDIDALLGDASGRVIAVLGPVNGDTPAVAIGGEAGVGAVVEEVAVPPEAEAPEVTVPEVEVPEAEISEVATPEVAVPEAEISEVATPEGAVPEEEGPEVSVPDAIVPEVEISETPVPEVNVPEVAVPEDDGTPAFTVDDVPEVPSSSGVEGETPEAFNVTGMEGEQYEAGDSPRVGVEPVDLDSGGDLGVAGGADGDIEVTTGDQVGAAGQDDAEVEVVATGEDTSIGIEGFEIEGGVELEGPSDEPEGTADDAEGLLIPEPAAPGASAGIDFGKLDFAASGPATTSDSLSELVVDEPPREAEVEDTAPERRLRYRGLARLERRRKRAAFIRLFLTALATILIVGGGGFAAAYYGLINYPGITPPNRVRSYVPPPVALPGPVPQSAIMSHVLLIDAWRSIETPLTTADALRTRLPDLLFFVSPLEVEGARQFALYVGPAFSAVEANALKGPLALVMDRLDPNDWSVLNAPYAFYFGEYDSATNAEARVQALAGNSIPAYSLQVAYSDGTMAVRVYGGAYADEFQAAEMGRMINDAEVGGMVLTSRRGTLPE